MFEWMKYLLNFHALLALFKSNPFVCPRSVGQVTHAKTSSRVAMHTSMVDQTTNYIFIRDRPKQTESDHFWVGSFANDALIYPVAYYLHPKG
jgi:hypothetical protein